MVTCCGGGHVDGGEGGARHRPSISNEAGKQRGGRRAVVRQRSQNANRELLHTHPPAAGSCRCDGRILAPAPLTLAYQRKLGRRARPIPAAAFSPGWTRTCHSAAAALDIRAPPPPYIFITLYNNKRPLADAAALIFFFSHRASWFFRDDTHGGGAFPSRQTPSYTSRHTQQHQQHNNNHILHSNEHDRGVYFLISAFSPSVYTGKGGRRNQWWWWWCRLPCHSLHTFFHLLS